MKRLNFDAHFVDLFNHTNDLIHFVDMDSRILTVNPAWVRNLGFSLEEVKGKCIYDFIDLDYSDMYLSYRQDVISKKEASEIEFCFKAKDGEQVIVDGQVGCVYEEEEPVYTRGVFRNITAKKQAETWLERSQRRLNAFLTSAPSAVIVIDSQQTILEWNPKAEQIFGFSADEVLGQKLADKIIPLEYREKHTRGMLHFLKTGEGPVLNKTVELTALNKLGKRFPINLSISNVRVENEWLFIGFISDITEHKLLQEENIRQESQILQSKLLDQKKDEFLSMASHELKTPLTSLKAYVQLIEKAAAEGKPVQLPFVGKASSNILRLESLIADLLDVSKIKANKIHYNFETFSFKEMLEESVESIRFSTYTHSIILENYIDVICFADKPRIEQVVQNLISNAIKYSPEAEKVLINSELINGQVRVSVRDFGIGIDNQNIKHLFKRFWRVENGDMKFQGLGIGLYISKEIIERHQGSLWVESEPGKGSTFYFSLPLSAS
ncbi:MAG: PAS domain-containing sensor histidine kinase [Daejeonella sp.]